jgi:ParB family transcriptional regulator, chromosome partitioning protein
LNAVETARSFRKLIDDFGLTQEEAARRLGQSRSHVANMLRILDLPGEILVHVSRGTIAPGAARALLSLGERDQQKTLAAKIVDEGLSVRAVEDAVKKIKRGEKPEAARDPAARANVGAAETDLQQVWGTKVEIVGGEQSGTVRLHYHSKRQLVEMVARLLASEGAVGAADADD